MSWDDCDKGTCDTRIAELERECAALRAEREQLNERFEAMARAVGTSDPSRARMTLDVWRSERDALRAERGRLRAVFQSRGINWEEGADVAVIVDHTLTLAKERHDALQGAIHKHHSERGDDRCWLDDLALYKAAGIQVQHGDTVLPTREEFLANCARFWESRQTANAKYTASCSLTEACAERDAAIRQRDALAEAGRCVIKPVAHSDYDEVRLVDTEAIAQLGAALALLEALTQPAPELKPLRHGVSCVKRYHVSSAAGYGYMHADDDDGPYDVDGVKYCGRCHEFIAPAPDGAQEGKP